MSTLREDQLYTYATAAGFTGSARDTIVAISQAESGGNTASYNPNDPSGGSYGVLQINGAHFQSGATNQKCALDPLCSFKFAYRLSSAGTDFSPWGSYTSGSYTKFLNPGGPKYTSPNKAGTQPSANVLNTPGGIIAQISEHSMLFLVAIVAVIAGFVIMTRRES